MSIRSAFVNEFGAENAAAIEVAAHMHDMDSDGIYSSGENGRGSDPFKWALCICIGFECVTRYAKNHGITADPDQLKEWVYYHADLASHDGGIDHLALFVGTYEGWVNTDAATWEAL